MVIRSPSGEARRLRRQLLVGTAGLLVARLLLGLPRPGPVYLADEVGYLTNARVLGGGLGADLLHTSYFRGGYSLLLTPVLALAGDPAAEYRLVLVVNALLAASLVPLLYLFLTRSLRVAPRAAVWPAIGAACYPSVTLTSGMAMSENLLLPLVVAWLLTVSGTLTAATARAGAAWAAAMACCAAVLWAAHGRMVVVVAVSAAVLVGLVVVRRRPAVWPAACGLLVLACGLVAVRALNDFLIRENYGDRRFDDAEERVSSLEDLDGVLSVARNLVGHSWYLLVATLGVVLVLLVVDGRRLASRVASRTADTSDVVLTVLLVTTAGILVLSALSFPDPARPDQIVYGRYVEVMVPPLLAVGLTALAAGRLPRRAWGVAAVLLGLAGVVAVLRAGLDFRGPVGSLNVTSLPFRVGSLGPSSLLGAGVVASACALALLAVARRSSGAVVPLLLLLFLPTTAYFEQILLERSRDVYPSGWTSPEPVVSAENIETVAFDVDGADREAGDIYPWLITSAVVVRFDGRTTRPPSRSVVSTGRWPRDHPEQPAEALWKDPARDQTLWRLTRPDGRARRVEVCLEAAGLTATRGDPGAQPGASELTVELSSGERARVLVFVTERAAAAHARNVERLVRAAGRLDATVIARRGTVVGTWPAAIPRDGERRLRRCL